MDMPKSICSSFVCSITAKESGEKEKGEEARATAGSSQETCCDEKRHKLSEYHKWISKVA
jgi:hypothetical protein